MKYHKQPLVIHCYLLERTLSVRFSYRSSLHIYLQTSQLAVQEEQELLGPIITQSGPKVQALIIISSHDRKIKHLAPKPLFSVSLAPMHQVTAAY